MDQNVRPDFYEGQYLGAEDLDGVVDYDRVQRARHGLGAHTWGIAAGLELRERKLPSGDVEVSILPGVAWDGYYRTIVVLAPAVVTTDKFANFLADTPPDGLLIKVWLRYAEKAGRPPAPGFEVCRPDGSVLARRRELHYRGWRAHGTSSWICEHWRPHGGGQESACGISNRRARSVRRIRAAPDVPAGRQSSAVAGAGGLRTLAQDGCAAWATHRP